MLVAVTGCGQTAGADLEVSALVPDRAVVGQTLPVEIQGRGFRLPVVSDLDNGVYEVGEEITATIGALDLESESLRDETVIDAVVPGALPAGVYDLSLRFADGSQISVEDAFVVGVACAGPGDCGSCGDCADGVCEELQPDRDMDGHVDARCGGDDCDDDCAACAPDNGDPDDSCDGLDQDCDGLFDEGSGGDTTTFYPDLDADGFTTDDPILACADPDVAEGDPDDNWLETPNPEDCDDDDPTIVPSGEIGSCDDNVPCTALDICNPDGTCTNQPSCNGSCFQVNDCESLCTQDCSAGCPASGCCTESCGGVCQDCPPGCTCVSSCANGCNLECVSGSVCQLDSGTSSACEIDSEVTCRDGSVCEMRCEAEDESTCDMICEPGAQCRLFCTGKFDRCDLDCQGGSPMTCADGFACNRSC